ncbi:allograft inflammatory factor 1-like isoform X2 [Cuculus canorus]|uniref:allograft inflammatory factor 1-like isoform X2 n=1 Tax=Cuculus canorus TaxID=55661 RepID=UPI0023AAA2FA|nr:allograft inflammatory factor 1-like isoform X2 [Cuculus canorus]
MLCTGQYSSGLYWKASLGFQQQLNAANPGACSTGYLGLADLMSVKRMMEKLGAPKTHLELKKMISEVTGGVSETISYQDFVNVMLGKRSAVLKLVMMFEGKANESNPKPSGPPPERDIASLP